MDGSSYGYAGEWTDASELQYLRARYYLPATGRFISKDPFPGLLTQPASLTPYVYALNNPVLFTDPSGLYVESPLDIAFIFYDVVSIAWDVYRINRSPCYSYKLTRQLWIDSAALAIDIFFLALPGATGGGMLFKYALVGANSTLDLIHAVGVAKTGALVTQSIVKGGQVGLQAETTISYFNGSGSGKRKGQNVTDAANKLGYTQRIPPQKAPFNSHGQPVFKNPKTGTYITPDIDSHIGGVWKMFDSKFNRIGTFDENLTRIGN